MKYRLNVIGRDEKVCYSRYHYLRYTFLSMFESSPSTQEDGNQSQNLSGHML